MGALPLHRGPTLAVNGGPTLAIAAMTLSAANLTPEPVNGAFPRHEPSLPRPCHSPYPYPIQVYKLFDSPQQADDALVAVCPMIPTPRMYGGGVYDMQVDTSAL